MCIMRYKNVPNSFNITIQWQVGQTIERAYTESETNDDDDDDDVYVCVLVPIEYILTVLKTNFPALKLWWMRHKNEDSEMAMAKLSSDDVWTRCDSFHFFFKLERLALMVSESIHQPEIIRQQNKNKQRMVHA